MLLSRTTPTYKGNPNLAISAIDVSGGIVCSRTSGTTPCFIQVSASAIAASGVVDLPYEDLEFWWNFGDADGVEYFTRPTDLQTVNANTDQWGPEAAYCYRNPGTYTVTLHIRGQRSTTDYLTATAQATITVSAYSATTTVYFDQNATGANNGTSAADAYTAITNLSDATFWGAHKTNCKIKLANGSHWTGSKGIRVTNSVTLAAAFSGLRIENYQGSYSASTSHPIIDVSSGVGTNTDLPLDFGACSSANAAWSKTDCVVTNVDFRVSGTTAFSNCVNVNVGTNAISTLSNIYLDGCNVYSGVQKSGDLVSWNSSRIDTVLQQYGGVWGGSITNPVYTTGTPNPTCSIAGSPDNWWFVVGVSFSGSSGNQVTQHFIYPETQTHALYKWISFGETGSGSTYAKGFCINVNWNGTSTANGGITGGFGYADYHCISECDSSHAVQPATWFVDGSQSNPSATATFATDGTGTITLTITTPPVNAQIIFVTNGALPSEITPMTPYYVVFSSGSTIKISATQGGSAITFATAGTGTHNQLQCLFRNLVIERNALSVMGADALYQPTGTNTCTFRDNRIWNYTFGKIFAPSPTLNYAFRGKVYYNLIDGPSGLPSWANYINQASGWRLAQQFTNNVIVDRRTTASFLTMDWTYVPSNGSIVNSNTYVTTTNSYVFTNNVTTKTFAQWQAQGIDTPDSTLSTTSPWGASPTSWSGFGANGRGNP